MFTFLFITFEYKKNMIHKPSFPKKTTKYYKSNNASISKFNKITNKNEGVEENKIQSTGNSVSAVQKSSEAVSEAISRNFHEHSRGKTQTASYITQVHITSRN